VKGLSGNVSSSTALIRSRLFGRRPQGALEFAKRLHCFYDLAEAH
jgi:hypothetical protein